MADVKIYVEVHNFAVKDIFESKHKSRLIALMKKTAEKAIKDKLALGAPKDKGGQGLHPRRQSHVAGSGQGAKDAAGQVLDIDLERPRHRVDSAGFGRRLDCGRQQDKGR
jgi:hypothetical protein